MRSMEENAPSFKMKQDLNQDLDQFESTALEFQEAGYEKLHNFLADVPGLSLIGAGNRMELKLGDRDAFERFSDDLLVGREAPQALREQQRKD